MQLNHFLLLLSDNRICFHNIIHEQSISKYCKNTICIWIIKTSNKICYNYETANNVFRSSFIFLSRKIELLKIWIIFLLWYKKKTWFVQKILSQIDCNRWLKLIFSLIIIQFQRADIDRMWKIVNQYFSILLTELVRMRSWLMT